MLNYIPEGAQADDFATFWSHVRERNTVATLDLYKQHDASCCAFQATGLASTSPFNPHLVTNADLQAEV